MALNPNLWVVYPYVTMPMLCALASWVEKTTQMLLRRHRAHCFDAEPFNAKAAAAASGDLGGQF